MNEEQKQAQPVTAKTSVLVRITDGSRTGADIEANPDAKPEIELLANPAGYKQMTVEKNMTIQMISSCHLQPVTGIVHIGYFSNFNAADLSSVKQMLKYCCRQPQTQQKLTLRIAGMIKEAFECTAVAVVIETEPGLDSAWSTQGQRHSVLTADYSGKFVNTEVKNEFLKYAGF